MLSWAPKKGYPVWPANLSMSQGQTGLAKTTSEVAPEKADPFLKSWQSRLLNNHFQDSPDINFLAGTVENTAST